MFVDNFILNGRANGDVAEALSGVRFDPGYLRPFIETDPRAPARMRGRRCVTINTREQIYNERTKRFEPKRKTVLVEDLMRRGIMSKAFLVGNASTLTRDAWINIDNAIVKANRNRLQAWADLAGANSISGFDAMAKMTHEYWAMSDPGEALQDMDGVADGRADTPLLLPTSVPLPITHSDFRFTQREIAVSRNTGAPLDTTMAEAAGRRVAEMVERQTIGTETGITYGTRSTGPDPHRGTSTVYGYTNYAYRVTKTDLTTPAGTNPEAVMTDILEMIETMNTNGFFGPFILYHSTPYSRYLNDDYFRSGSTSAVRSLRERLMEIEGLQDIRRLDYLTSGYQLILVQMDPQVAQAIDGMSPTTVQWEEKGGLEIRFKVMAIQVPVMKAPYNGVAGIIHGTTS